MYEKWKGASGHKIVKAKTWRCALLFLFEWQKCAAVRSKSKTFCSAKSTGSSAELYLQPLFWISRRGGDSVKRPGRSWAMLSHCETPARYFGACPSRIPSHTARKRNRQATVCSDGQATSLWVWCLQGVLHTAPHHTNGAAGRALRLPVFTIVLRTHFRLAGGTFLDPWFNKDLGKLRQEWLTRKYVAMRSTVQQISRGKGHVFSNTKMISTVSKVMFANLCTKVKLACRRVSLE